LKVLLLSENASLQLGGEAALAVHWFRELSSQGVPVWLLSHERSREALIRLFPSCKNRMVFVEDNWLQAGLWQLGRLLPRTVALFSTGWCIRLLTQLRQRQRAKQLIREQAIDVVHLTMPVSPLEPTLIRSLGAPLVIGPLNGGMSYPPEFAHRESGWVRAFMKTGRALAGLANRWLPGKVEAACLLAANERTRHTLLNVFPDAACKITVLPENGVDLSVWYPAPKQSAAVLSRSPVRLLFAGRLVDWKGVDLLLEAFARAVLRSSVPLSLSKVFFHGWLPTEACAERMRQADVLVLPSLLECGGAVVLEAMASGLPVIACKWGGPSDYLDDECGVLLPVHSEPELIDALTRAMVTLAEAPRLRHAMGQAAIHKVRSHYNWTTKAKEIMDIYRLASRTHA
jgi:glycosyltransferase involved in cell wall biosynthesis